MNFSSYVELARLHKVRLHSAYWVNFSEAYAQPAGALLVAWPSRKAFLFIP